MYLNNEDKLHKIIICSKNILMKLWTANFIEMLWLQAYVEFIELEYFFYFMGSILKLESYVFFCSNNRSCNYTSSKLY
jgi:hypothetical protein